MIGDYRAKEGQNHVYRYNRCSSCDSWRIVVLDYRYGEYK